MENAKDAQSVMRTEAYIQISWKDYDIDNGDNFNSNHDSRDRSTSFQF